MGTLKQNDLEHIIDMMQRGKLTADEANVKKVQMQRVLLVTQSIPADVRRTLNRAVKSKELGHIKKDGRKPEAFFCPSFEYLVAGERKAHERKVLEALKSVCV